MPTPLTIGLEFVEDSTKLLGSAALVYLALMAYVRRHRPVWVARLECRRTALLLAIILAAVAIKLTEDVLGGEARPVDRVVLLFIRHLVPAGSDAGFAVITRSGDAGTMVPLTAAAAVLLLAARRYRDLVLLVGSVGMAASMVYGIKLVIGRERPSLWETQWYWGSSFPSGHTLVVAAFATASALIIGRLLPAVRWLAASVAFAWIVLVALSRLVLGVHWPTDVLAAACIGASIPFAMAIALEPETHP